MTLPGVFPLFLASPPLLLLSLAAVIFGGASMAMAADSGAGLPPFMLAALVSTLAVLVLKEVQALQSSLRTAARCPMVTSQMLLYTYAITPTNLVLTRSTRGRDALY
eukprot:1400771-Rhodomonas_salina.1